MKKLFFTLLMLVLITSCQKENVGPYQQVPDPIDTTSVLDNYTNGGTLPGGGTTSQGMLSGTNWILVKFVRDYTTTLVGDTIHFINNNEYRLNSEQSVHGYVCYTAQNNVTLTINNFASTNSMTCSTNELGVGFVEYGEINGAEFTNQYNSGNNFRAWFVKI